ncbi:hypothetical protein CORC01_02625 [Colletotrichum orchidophilum]|uniref:Uncharacterized protein n=1 Tax=Colletotrichum orchidophilum TaxID=1209926 RepID=A0A1G4BL67_9PEZI|nr:uncharacterized protein CORC01_02625 [Colletotrichum orchidophilum]OHF02046.1 hypothetical protein CORC01_02625 [Colletotrichum orchidophilum]
MSQKPVDVKELRERLKQRESTSKEFNEIWEKEGLQLLRETLRSEYDGDYSITIRFKYQSNTRSVDVTTPEELSAGVKDEILSTVSSCFADSERLLVTVEFLVGIVEHAADAVTSSQDADNKSKRPRNSGKYDERMLGDSVSFEESDSAATLGPAIKLGGCEGWIVNWHLFDGIPNGEHVHDPSEVPHHSLFHPAYIDCGKNEKPSRIGELKAYSGQMYRTTRPSRSLQHHVPGVPGECKQGMQVVTDWAFCRACGDEAKNRLRYVPRGIEVDDSSDPIRGVYEQRPQLQIIQTTGRSSGFRYAVVCDTPAEVRQYPHMPTREWYLENLEGLLTVEEWNSEGPGVSGDSGAAVVHDETGKLLGQIWGRNVYGGDQQVSRVTYFTHHWDIFDDIKERYPNLEGPFLISGPNGDISRTTVAREYAHDPSGVEADENTLSPSRPRSRACSSIGTGDGGVTKSFSQSTLVQSVTNSLAPGEGGAKEIHLEKTLEGEMDCGRDSHSRSAARTSADDGALTMRRSSAMGTA